MNGRFTVRQWEIFDAYSADAKRITWEFGVMPNAKIDVEKERKRVALDGHKVTRKRMRSDTFSRFVPSKESI